MAKNFDQNFEFPPSIQSDLFNYLKPKQQEFIKPVLRILKKPAQMELCCSLIDYMESGNPVPPADFTLAALFMYLTREGMEENNDPKDVRIIRPLKVAKVSEVHGFKEPQRIGDIIKQIFGKNFNH